MSGTEEELAETKTKDDEGFSCVDGEERPDLADIMQEKVIRIRRSLDLERGLS